MRDTIGKTGSRLFGFAGRTFYRVLSLVPLAGGIAAAFGLISALNAGNLLGMTITAMGSALCFALVWYMWRPERSLSELD